MPKTVLIPIPDEGFDPTEVAIPWRILRQAGHSVAFTTPSGRPGQADPRIVTGKGLGPWSGMLRAARPAVEAYAELLADPGFQHPLPYAAWASRAPGALVLPGGHAPGMKAYLETAVLQDLVARAWDARTPIGAICHGVVLAARSRTKAGHSVLKGRRTTALPAWMELSAWGLTCLWLGRYYRTYPQTVQAEVTSALESPRHFEVGPWSNTRDEPSRLDRGFVVRDGHYLSARWPGDAHRFGTEFLSLLAQG